MNKMLIVMFSANLLNVISKCSQYPILLVLTREDMIQSVISIMFNITVGVGCFPLLL